MKKNKLLLSKALKFRINEDGHMFGLLSQSDGEFYISPEVLSLLTYFSKPKTDADIHKIHEYIKQYFSNVVSEIPEQAECMSIIEDLKSAGFLIEELSTSSFRENDGGFADAWIQWAMLADSYRSKAYHAAIKKMVNKNSVVLDIGSGTGYLSACALSAGAQKVYAVEETQISQTIFKTLDQLSLIKNNDQFVLYEKNSFDVDIPKKVNLVVSELFGNDPFQEGFYSTLKDITERISHKEVEFIPNKLEVYAEIVDVLDHPIQERIHLYQKTKINLKASTKPGDFYQQFLNTITNTLDFESISFPIQLLENQFKRVGSSVLLGECSLNPIPCNEKIFANKFKGKAELSYTKQDFTSPIVLLWFRAYLADKISISSHPCEVDFAHHWSPIAIVLNTSHLTETLSLQYELSSSLNVLHCDVKNKNTLIGKR